MQRNLTAHGRRMVTIVDPHIKRDAGYSIHKEAEKNGLYIKVCMCVPCICMYLFMYMYYYDYLYILRYSVYDIIMNCTSSTHMYELTYTIAQYLLIIFIIFPCLCVEQGWRRF